MNDMDKKIAADDTRTLQDAESDLRFTRQENQLIKVDIARLKNTIESLKEDVDEANQRYADLCITIVERDYER